EDFGIETGDMKNERWIDGNERCRKKRTLLFSKTSGEQKGKGNYECADKSLDIQRCSIRMPEDQITSSKKERVSWHSTRPRERISLCEPIGQPIIPTLIACKSVW